MHKDRFDSVPGHHKIKHLREIVSVFFVPMSQLGVSYFYCTTVTPIVLLPSKHTPSINNPLTDTAKYFGDGWWEMPSNHCPPHRRVTVASSADRQHAQALVCLAAETRSQGLRIQDSKELYSQLVSLHGRSGHAYYFAQICVRNRFFWLFSVLPYSKLLARSAGDSIFNSHSLQPPQQQSASQA